MGRIIVITLYNKPNLVAEAIESVLKQTRPALHIVARDTHADFTGRYAPAVFFNEWARVLNDDDYFCWLSDDDLLLPNYVADLAGFLDEHPDANACYGYSHHKILDTDGIMTDYRTLPPEGPIPFIFDEQHLPQGKIDGGQVMIRRRALSFLGEKFAPEALDGNERLNDAAWLNKLALAYKIHPVGTYVLINRTTLWSAHTRPSVGSSIVHHDWKYAEGEF